MYSVELASAIKESDRSYSSIHYFWSVNFVQWIQLVES